MNVFLDFLAVRFLCVLQFDLLSLNFSYLKIFDNLVIKLDIKGWNWKKIKDKIEDFYKGIVHFYSEFPKRFNIFDNTFLILLNSQKKIDFLLLLLKNILQFL